MIDPTRANPDARVDGRKESYLTNMKVVFGALLATLLLVGPAFVQLRADPPCILTRHSSLDPLFTRWVNIELERS